MVTGGSAIVIERIGDAFPDGMASLRAEARGERFRFIERLAEEWETGATRFDQEGECLLVARMNAVLAGLGGVTRDPFVPGALRMRRFYVRRDFRRRGIGRALARRLLEQAIRCCCPITVNAGTPEAAAFWESLGFTRDPRKGHTHVLLRGC